MTVGVPIQDSFGVILRNSHNGSLEGYLDRTCAYDMKGAFHGLNIQHPYMRYALVPGLPELAS